ncbi:DUF523 domain-containing protein [Alicyclobacillus sp. SO9]|uniref:DUF523 domain-containing protein n=1 Tax=Alicyclobacillus sp. SO9 TaxID=2665646 RepID=UPI0018E7A2EC|nr:DUF523 domain-containing protein [Alicyclobacillus sp. SO9]QQE81334.1 DUF523 domain-containing protein [Alicyclobacillus sp. SO9]
MKIVSSCLIGCKCRYDNKSALSPEVEKLVQSREAVPVCPEQLGGLPTPRFPAEIVGGDGFDVIDGTARVIDSHGNDVTQSFINGAYRTLNVAETIRATTAILKKNSPSCGSNFIYDGSFSGNKKEGVGVTTALLIRNGLVVSDEDTK